MEYHDDNFKKHDYRFKRHKLWRRRKANKRQVPIPLQDQEERGDSSLQQADSPDVT